MGPYARGDYIEKRFLVLDHRSGGFADVYLVFDTATTEMVCRALKLLRYAPRPNSEADRAFRREMACWVSISPHPNVTRCFVSQNIDDAPAILLEWVCDSSGQTRNLRTRMREECLTALSIAQLTHDICSGLLHCKSELANFAHGDLKPENVLIGGDDAAKITDLGLARSQYTAASSGPKRGVFGTPAYMAPELWGGAAPSERSDVYALGCLIYEAICGNLPFRLGSLEALRLDHLEAVPVVPTVTDDYRLLLDIALRCLSKEVDQRPSVADVLQAMESGYAIRNGDVTPVMRGTDHGNRALTLMEAGRYGEALAEFDIALSMDPNLSRAYHNRALLFIKMKEPQRALTDLDRAISIDPKFPEAYHSRAQFYLIHGEIDKGLLDARKIVELSPHWPVGRTTLGMLLSQVGEHKEALEHLWFAFKERPDDSRTRLLLAEALIATDRPEEGETVVGPLTRSEDLSTFLKANFARIEAIARQGKNDAALAAFHMFVLKCAATGIGEPQVMAGASAMEFRKRNLPELAKIADILSGN